MFTVVLVSTGAPTRRAHPRRLGRRSRELASYACPATRRAASCQDLRCSRKRDMDRERLAAYLGIGRPRRRCDRGPGPRPPSLISPLCDPGRRCSENAIVQSNPGRSSEYARRGGGATVADDLAAEAPPPVAFAGSTGAAGCARSCSAHSISTRGPEAETIRQGITLPDLKYFVASVSEMPSSSR